MSRTAGTLTPRTAGRRTGARIVLAAVATTLLGSVAPSEAGARPTGNICDAEPDLPQCGQPVAPTGTLDAVSRSLSGVVVSGTARDDDGEGWGPVQVQVTIGGAVVGTLSADGPNGSFSGTVAPRRGSNVCARAVNQGWPMYNETTLIGCKPLEVKVDPFGALEEVSASPAGLRIKGWTIDPDTAAPINIEISRNTELIHAGSAALDRPDVGAAHPGYGSAHGFDVTVPTGRGQYNVCVSPINVGPYTNDKGSSSIGCLSVTQGGAPNAPSLSLRADPVVTHTVHVDWTDNSTDELRFNIERSTSGGAHWWSVARPNPIGGSGTRSTWDDTGWGSGMRICYRITAENAYGTSTSATSCVTTLQPALPKPTGLGATNVTKTELTLTWTDNATNEESYVITGAASVTLPARTGTGPMSHQVTGLQPGTRYCFDVGPSRSDHRFDPASVCADTRPVGLKTAQFWNCDSGRRTGSVWMFNHGTGIWTRSGSLPSSWTQYGCGPSYSGPAAQVSPPNGAWVTMAVVMLNGTTCTADDPSNANCRRWQTGGPVLGDSTGLVLPVQF